MDVPIKTFVQCQNCGNVFQAEGKFKIDELYINYYCPKCGTYRVIQLGENYEDIFEFYNVNIDNKFF